MPSASTCLSRTCEYLPHRQGGPLKGRRQGWHQALCRKERSEVLLQLRTMFLLPCPSPPLVAGDSLHQFFTSCIFLACRYHAAEPAAPSLRHRAASTAGRFSCPQPPKPCCSGGRAHAQRSMPAGPRCFDSQKRGELREHRHLRCM